jgi:AraC-like DNA-binding protein
MPKDFSGGFVIAMHEHERDQLLYATSGIMRLRTVRETWIVPRDGAVYIPGGVQHAISMHGEVDMRTLYIDTKMNDAGPRAMCVVAVSNLLRELILAFSEEPTLYDQEGCGGLITQMIELEIARARELSLKVPLPKEARLQRLCAEFLANPANWRTLDAWSDAAGASTRTLVRLFEHDLGVGFNRWRQRIRFHNALEALSRGEPISRVAQQHGYRSASPFSAAFS